MNLCCARNAFDERQKSSCSSTPFYSHVFPIAPLFCNGVVLQPLLDLSRPGKENKSTEIANANGIFQTKREIFFVAPSSAVDLFRGVQEFGQDVTAMMSLADRLLCLLWSLPLCLGAPVGI